MKVKIQIDTLTFVRFWLVVIGFALAALAIYSALTALIIIGAALFLALALNAPVSWLARNLPGRSRVGGTAIAFVVVVAVLGTVMFLVFPPIVQQTAKFVKTVPTIVDSASTQYQGFNSLIHKYNLEDQVDQAAESIRENSLQWAASIGQNVVGSLSAFATFAVSVIITLVMAFLMLVEGPRMLKKLWSLYDDEDEMETHKLLAKKMYNVVNGYVVGQLTVAAVGSTIMGLFVFILSLMFNVPANLAIPSAAVYFVLAMIPMFGTTVAAALIGLLLLLNDPNAALTFVIGFIIYQQIENNMIAPSIQSKKMELTALWILVAVTIGLYVFGVIGGIISIPIAGCLKVLFDHYVEHNKKRKTRKKPIEKLVKKATEA